MTKYQTMTPIKWYRITLETPEGKKQLDAELKKHGVKWAGDDAIRLITWLDPMGRENHHGKGVYVGVPHDEKGGYPHKVFHFADYDEAYQYLDEDVAPALHYLLQHGKEASMLVTEAVTDDVWYLAMRRMPRGDVLMLYEHLESDGHGDALISFEVYHVPFTEKGVQKEINKMLCALRARFRWLKQDVD